MWENLSYLRVSWKVCLRYLQSKRKGLNRAEEQAMNGISAQYVDGLEIRIKELREQVENAKQVEAAATMKLGESLIKIGSLEEKVEKLTKELDNTKQVEFPRRVQKVTDALKRKHEKELAALAEQNAKMRAFVIKVSEQTPEKPDYWSSCGQCEHNSSNAEDLLELPDLATPAINRIKSEGMREAAKWFRELGTEQESEADFATARLLDGMADELEGKK